MFANGCIPDLKAKGTSVSNAITARRIEEKKNLGKNERVKSKPKKEKILKLNFTGKFSSGGGDEMNMHTPGSTLTVI